MPVSAGNARLPGSAPNQAIGVARADLMSTCQTLYNIIVAQAVTPIRRP